MDPNLEFNSITFAKSFDEEGRSVRQSSSRAVNTPDIMTIQSQPYVDGSTKVGGNRYVVRFDRVDITDGVRHVSSAYLVLAIPGIASETAISAIVATFKAAVADADLIVAVLNNEK